MGDIGTPIREVEFEPIDPANAPLTEPAAPSIPAPEPEKVPA